MPEAAPPGRANGGHLHANVLNLAIAKARDEFIDRLPEAIRAAAVSAAIELASLADSARELAGTAEKEDEEEQQVFEALEPWDESVSGADLLAAIITVLERFLVLPPGGVEAVALWVLHAWGLDAFQISPILAITSAERSAGKSQGMDVLQMLVPRPMRDTNPSDAVIFRTIEQYQPTVMLDEADTIDWRSRSELLGMVNNGYRRTGAFVWRCDGDDHRSRPFRVWAAKVLAGLKSLPDTTASRSIVIRMERKAKTKKLDRLRWDRVYAELQPLRRQVLRWATEHVVQLGEADPALPAGFTDRQQDNWIPLLAIADHAGGDWSTRARTAAVALRAGRDSVDQGSIGEQLLGDIWDAFGDREVMPTREILEYLIGIENRPWGEWRGKPLSPQGLAALLRKFEIHPLGLTQRQGTDTFKGYARESFVRAWAIWLPDVTDLAAGCDGSGTVDPLNRHSGTARPQNTLGDRVTVVTDVTVPAEGSAGTKICPCGNRDAIQWGDRLWCPTCDMMGYTRAVKALLGAA